MVLARPSSPCSSRSSALDQHINEKKLIEEMHESGYMLDASAKLWGMSVLKHHHIQYTLLCGTDPVSGFCIQVTTFKGNRFSELFGDPSL